MKLLSMRMRSQRTKTATATETMSRLRKGQKLIEILHTLVPKSLGATEFIAKFSTAGSIAGLCWHGLNPWRVWRFGWCRPFHHMRNVTAFIEALLRRTLLTARNDRWRPSGNEGDLVSRGASAKKKGVVLCLFRINAATHGGRPA